MIDLSRLYLRICASAVLGAFVVCAAGVPAAPAGNGFGLKPGLAASSTSFVDVAAVNAPGGNQVIISEFEHNKVKVFGGNGRVNAVLNTKRGIAHPAGLATDSSGTLYVGNAGTHSILEFQKPYNSSPRILDDLDGYPWRISVDASTGDVAVTNSSVSDRYYVTIYSQTSTEPCAVLQSSGFSSLVSAAYDKAGDLYVTGYINYGPVGVGIIRGGCSATGITMLNMDDAIQHVDDIAVLKNGDVVLASGGLPAAAFTYAPPAHGSLGSPLFRTPMPGTRDVAGIAFRAQDQSVWVAVAADGPPGLIANRYRWPAGGSPTAEIFDPSGTDDVAGIAVNPAQQL